VSLPRVSAIVEPYESWDMVPPAILAEAQERGTEVHRYGLALAQGAWAMVPPGREGYCLSLLNWFESAVETVVLAEERLTDPDLGFTGMPDLICRVKGDKCLSLADYKTALAPQRSWRLRMAAYWRLCRVNGYPVERVFSVQPRKDGSRAMIREYTGTAEEDFSVFLACLTAYKFFH
jgi:hypothetical protein